jgi:hypothetical protein
MSKSWQPYALHILDAIQRIGKTKRNELADLTHARVSFWKAKGRKK